MFYSSQSIRQLTDRSHFRPSIYKDVVESFSVERNGVITYYFAYTHGSRYSGQRPEQELFSTAEEVVLAICEKIDEIGAEMKARTHELLSYPITTGEYKN